MTHKEIVIEAHVNCGDVIIRALVFEVRTYSNGKQDRSVFDIAEINAKNNTATALLRHIFRNVGDDVVLAEKYNNFDFGKKKTLVSKCKAICYAEAANALAKHTAYINSIS
jgi:hypothetical protein